MITLNTFMSLLALALIVFEVIPKEHFTGIEVTKRIFMNVCWTILIVVTFILMLLFIGVGVRILISIYKSAYMSNASGNQINKNKTLFIKV